MLAIRGALTPLASCNSARPGSTTRTCCTPPLSSSLNSFFRSCLLRYRRAGRAIALVCPKTFHNGIVLLELFQAVKDLATLHLRGRGIHSHRCLRDNQTVQLGVGSFNANKLAFRSDEHDRMSVAQQSRRGPHDAVTCGKETRRHVAGAVIEAI